jgi:hypothetical protein
VLTACDQTLDLFKLLQFRDRHLLAFRVQPRRSNALMLPRVPITRYPTPSRRIASGTRSGDRSDQTGRALFRLPSARRAFRRRWASIADESRCESRLRLSSPRLRSGRSRVVRVMVFGPSRPSVGSARKERGLEPRAVNQIGTRPPGRWRDARRSTAPAPQSKPVTPSPRASWRRSRRRWHLGLA